VPRPIQLDWSAYPISLVIAVETSVKSEAVLDKLGGSGILFSQLLAADQGETAMISFSDETRVHLAFTADPDSVTASLRKLHVEGGGDCALDGIMAALKLLAGRKPGRRRVIFVIAEKRDRSSKNELPEVMREIQRQNAAIYWLTYSPLLAPLTAHAKTLKSDDPKINGTLDPDSIKPLDLVGGLSRLLHMDQPDLSSLFATATGAHTMNFLQKSALEDEIQAIGEEVHQQYIVSFQPPPGEPGIFHTIRVEVKDRPGLTAKTRAGYWSVQ
jgi:VWFA-related protein